MRNAVFNLVTKSVCSSFLNFQIYSFFFICLLNFFVFLLRDYKFLQIIHSLWHVLMQLYPWYFYLENYLPEMYDNKSLWDNFLGLISEIRFTFFLAWIFHFNKYSFCPGISSWNRKLNCHFVSSLSIIACLPKNF